MTLEPSFKYVRNIKKDVPCEASNALIKVTIEIFPVNT